MTGDGDARPGMTPTVDVARERRIGRVAGVAALLAVGCSFAALLIGASGTRPETGGRQPSDRAEQLVRFHDMKDSQETSVVVRDVGLVLVAGFTPFLFYAVRGRRGSLSPWLIATGIAGPLLIAGATTYGLFALSDVADEFVRSGARTAERADDLVHASQALDVTRWLDIGSRVIFGVWVVSISMLAMNVGLLSRFLGIWGIGAGAATAVVLPIGETFFAGWLASVGLLALGWWWGGRPPAWEQGQAVTWASQDRARAEARAADTKRAGEAREPER